MTIKIKRKKIISFLLIFHICANLPVVAQTRQSLSVTDVRKFDYFFYEGLKLKHAEKFDSSFEMFRHCLDIDSTSSAVLSELSTFYIFFDQPEKAVPLMKKAVAYTPANLEYRSMLATLLYNLDMYREAADEYEILAKAFPEKVELNFYLAEVYARMGETGKAINIFNTLENITGMVEALSMEKYRLYMTLQQPDSALNEIIKLIDKFPMEARYPIILGDLYMQQNNHTQALRFYQKAFEIDPGSPYYPVSMANYYERTGQSDSARLQINAALVNERLDFNTKLRILANYILQPSRQGDDGANELFQTLLEQHPDETQLKMIYGSYLSNQGKFEEARFQFQLATEIEPDNMEAWQQLLQLLLFQTEDLDEAIRISQKSWDIFPEEALFPYYIGLAYYQKKDFYPAIEAFEAAIRIVPAENMQLKSQLYSLIGDCYFRMRETDKAFNAYEEAIKYNERNIMVLNNYAYYLSLLKKDLAKAERMSATTIKMEPNNPTYIDTYAWIFFKQGNIPLALHYIEQAISKDLTNSAELVDHYGDILYFSGEKEKAVEQWMRAKELGKNTPTVNKKITEKTYFEDTEDELFSDADEDTSETDQ